jgi:hypothetical protein
MIELYKNMCTGGIRITLRDKQKIRVIIRKFVNEWRKFLDAIGAHPLTMRDIYRFVLESILVSRKEIFGAADEGAVSR